MTQRDHSNPNGAGGPEQWDPNCGHILSPGSALTLVSTSEVGSPLPEGIQEAIYFNRIPKKCPYSQKSGVMQQPSGAKDCVNFSLKSAES